MPMTPEEEDAWRENVNQRLEGLGGGLGEVAESLSGLTAWLQEEPPEEPPTQPSPEPPVELDPLAALDSRLRSVEQIIPTLAPPSPEEPPAPPSPPSESPAAPEAPATKPTTGLWAGFRRVLTREPGQE